MFESTVVGALSQKVSGLIMKESIQLDYHKYCVSKSQGDYGWVLLLHLITGIRSIMCYLADLENENQSNQIRFEQSKQSAQILHP